MPCLYVHGQKKAQNLACYSYKWGRIGCDIYHSVDVTTWRLLSPSLLQVPVFQRGMLSWYPYIIWVFLVEEDGHRWRACEQLYSTVKISKHSQDMISCLLHVCSYFHAPRTCSSLFQLSYLWHWLFNWVSKMWLIFFKFYLFFAHWCFNVWFLKAFCVCVYVCGFACHGMHIEMRRHIAGVGSLFTIWVLGVELSLSSFVAINFTHWTIF